MSKLEDKVASILRKSRVFYEREKTFKDLRGGRYRFDFYCPYLVHGAPAVIEVQGPQHYYQVTKFHKTRQEFLAAQERDRRKINYCLGNGIRIYCIPYWDLESISTLSELISPKYLALSQWKNDEDWRNFQKK